MRSILRKLLKGEISVEEAERAIESAQLKLDRVRFDILREKRTGFPEAVFAPGKSDEDIINIIKTVGDVIVTRLSPERAERIMDGLDPGDDYTADYHETARVLAVRSGKPERLGRIGILSGGTSDIPVAEEARVVAEESGCEVLTAYDVGVAGIHRLLEPLQDMLESDVKVLIVVAGMEGALPSVVAGLVDVPVIGVPASVGYGVGEGGFTALNSMLQSCSPGIGVVNIDNGFGAAVLAVKILRAFAGD